MTAYSDTGITPGWRLYRVRAQKHGGTYSPYSEYSNTVFITTQLTPPTNLTGTAISQTQINLSWTASTVSGNAMDGYHIYRNNVLIGTAPYPWTTYNNNSLICSTGYTYVVKTYKGALESEESNSITPSTKDCSTPAAPSGLTATVVSPTQIDLNWVDRSNNESDFHIERSPDGYSWTEIGTVPANVTTYSDTAVTCGWKLYRVRAQVHGGTSSPYSNFSNVVLVTAQTCP